MMTRATRSGWMLSGPRRAALVAVAGIAVGWAGATPAQEAAPKATEMIRDGFEGAAKIWRQEEPDATIEIYSHARTRRAAHEGAQSEGFEFKAGIGGGLYYSYALPKIPVTDDLAVTMYLRSNRSGMNVLARVVLPADVDPDSRRPSFVLIPSGSYEAVDRWQRIELDDMMPAIERQARVLRASSKRKVSLEGAYLDRLVVNVYGGEGVTDVFLDELSIGPVTAEVAEAHARLLRGEPARAARGGEAGAETAPTARTIADRPRTATEPLAPNIPGAADRIKFDRNRLTKDGYPWFPTIMRAFDTDPQLIRQLGSDIAEVPVDANADYLDTAIRSGLLVIPELGGDPDRDPDPATAPLRPIDSDRLVAAAANFPRKEHVFAWSLGTYLGEDLDMAARKQQLRSVRDTIRAIRKARPGGTSYTTGSVLGMLAEYARVPENLDMIGIPAATWATTGGPFEPLRYLEQRQLLTARSNADALLWSEVDVTAPAIYQRMIWGKDRPPEGGVPKVQPEQIRLATFAAIAAGCRGISFRAEGSLMQSNGRANAIEVAILNEEIDLLEPILADPDRSIRLLDTYMPDPAGPPPVTFVQTSIASINRTQTTKEQPPHPWIKAAAITTKDRRGKLLLVSDYEPYAQYQPSQMATNKLRLRVPAANDAVAYLISPGGVRPLDSVRVPGGHDITLEDFGVTATVLMTTNVDLKNQIEVAVNQVRPFAISLAIEQAEIQRAWVAEIDSRLALDGHPQRDAASLIAKADELIKSARDALEREDYPTAWDEARRVGRPLRILMRYHFMAAYDAIVKALNDEELPCGPVAYEDKKNPQPRLIAPMVAAPLASFNTLPQAWTWLEWIKRGRLGPNAVASGRFDFKSKDELFDAGWTFEGYDTDDVTKQVGLRTGGPDNTKQVEGQGSNLVLKAGPRDGLKLDALVPFADHPVVAVRSPAIPVKAGEMHRISVMVYLSNTAPPGAGGLIIRDSIGGERFQYRTPNALTDPPWFEVVYYRRVPADGTLSVTLGMAAVSGFAAFDDLRVEPIVEQVNIDQTSLATRPRRLPAATATTYNSDGTPVTIAPTAPRAALRTQPVPIRQ